MNKIKIIHISWLLLCIVKLSAQMLTPVHWSYGAKKTTNDTIIVFFKATIDPGWHIYSLKQPDGGPVKTSITFKKGEVKLLGGIIEPNPVRSFDKTFGIPVLYFSQEVIFTQKLVLKANTKSINGKLRFMVCNDHQCLPPEDVVFSVPIIKEISK